MAASRFATPVSDEAELEIRGTAIPRAATEWGLRIWNEWASCRPPSLVNGVLAVDTPLLQMRPADLAYWMAKFVLEVRKQNGSEYPPKTLYAVVCCFKRYYEQNGIHYINPLCPSDADDDFQPLKKRPKVNPADIKAMFPQSSLSHCTFNINFTSPQ